MYLGVRNNNTTTRRTTARGIVGRHCLTRALQVVAVPFPLISSTSRAIIRRPFTARNAEDGSAMLMHVDTFGSRLKKEGIECQVVGRRIGMSADLIGYNERVRKYIGLNPQHIDDVYQEVQKLNAQRGSPMYTFDDDEAGSGPGVI
jgi:hypothetical protein